MGIPKDYNGVDNMILEMFISLIFGLVGMLVAIIPDIQLSDGFMNGMGSVSTVVGYMAYVLPMGVMSACVGVFITLSNIKFIIGIFNFVVRKIPFIG